MEGPKRFEITLERAPDEVPQYVWATPKLELMIVRDRGRVRAFTSICPHMGARLCWDAGASRLHCPWHGLAAPADTLATGHPRWARLREWTVEASGARVVVSA